MKCLIVLKQLELPGAAMKRHEESGCPFEQILCPQHESGCTLKSSRRLMSSHVETCDYRKIDCPLAPTCTEKIVKKHLMNHLEKVHLSKGFFGSGSLQSHLKVFAISLIALCILSLLINFFFFLQYLS